MTNSRTSAFYFDGKLLNASIEDDSCLIVTAYKFVFPQNCLSKRGRCVYRSNHRDLSIYNVGTFVDTRTGITKPYVLVNSYRSKCLILLSLHIDGIGSKLNLVPIGKISTFDRTFEHIAVLSGPILICSTKTDLHIYDKLHELDEGQFGTKSKTIPMLEQSSKYDEFKLQFAKEFGNNEIFILIRFKSNDEAQMKNEFHVYSLKKMNGLWVNSEIETSLFLPEQYANTLLDCKIDFQSLKSKHGEHCDQCDRPLDVRVTLLLEGGYVVQLKSGRLLQCSVMSPEYVKDFHTDFNEFKLLGAVEESTVILKTETDVLVVNLDGEVVKTWSDVSGVLTGDFHRDGRLQLLVLFGHDSGREEFGHDSGREEFGHDSGSEGFESWLLTDLNGLEIDSRDGENAGKDDRPKSFVLAVEALCNNLESQVANVRETEQHLLNKLLFLTSTWQQQQRRSEGRGTTLNKPEIPLVTLIGSASNQEEPRTVDNPQIETRILWKTTVESSLVIGVQIRNTSNGTFSNCAVSLVQSSSTSDNTTTSSLSRWPINLCDLSRPKPSGDHNSTKKLKLDLELSQTTTEQSSGLLRPGDVVTLATCTELGSQNGCELWLVVTVATVRETKDRTETETKQTVDRRTFCGGRISVTTQDLLQGNLGVTSDLRLKGNEDPDVVRMSLDAIQRQTLLQVTSTFTDLTHLAAMLESQCGFELSQSQSCLFNLSCVPLRHVRISQPQSISRRQANLPVWTRNCDQLLLLVELLYFGLPDDLLVSRVPNDSVTSRPSALGEMRREVRAVSNSLTTVLNESGETAKSLFCSDVATDVHDPEARDQEVRGRFEEQRKMAARSKVMLDGHKTEKLVGTIRNFERKTDEAFADLK